MKDPRGRLRKSRPHQEWRPTAAYTLAGGAFHRAAPGTCPRPTSFIRSTMHDVNAEPLAHSQEEAHSGLYPAGSLQTEQREGTGEGQSQPCLERDTHEWWSGGHT